MLVPRIVNRLRLVGAMLADVDFPVLLVAHFLGYHFQPLLRCGALAADFAHYDFGGHGFTSLPSSLS